MYSEEIRKIVNYQRNLGYSYSEIASNLNIPRPSIITIINYKRKAHKKKIGRKSIINKYESLNIRRFIENENNNGKKVTCNTIIAATEILVSRRTLNNFLIKEDYKYMKGVQKIVLSKHHMDERLSIISKWIHENINWDATIFSDEKRFSLDGPDNW